MDSHMSCKATELLEAEAGRRISQLNTTRWNSTFKILDAIVKIDTKCKDLLACVVN